MKRRYSTDLYDAEWRCIEPHIRSPNKRGRPQIYSLRYVLDAVFYILRSGCPWRLLPHEFPPWRIVHYWFRRWRIDGTFERLNAALRERLRTRLGRNAQPSAGIVDSQPARTAGVGGENIGDTTEPRRCAGVSAIFWWTPKGWSSRSRSIALRSPTKTA
jgi:putative transposase